jgi:hypothetical protein
MTPLTWDDLAAVALLGTRRRALRGGGVGDGPLPGLPPALGEAVAVVTRARAADRPAGAEPDAAEHLLDVAALAVTFRRAGLRTRPARPLPDPAPADPRRAAGPAASARLASLLGGADRELLELWLTTAADRGLRAPDQLLPALLDHAVRVPAHAPVAARVAGTRGRWLAHHRRDWAGVLDGVAAGAVGPGAPEPAGEGPAAAGEHGSWELGTPAERVAWLGRRRTTDPAPARRLLQKGWAQEEPVHRAALLGALALGLGPDDEPFLERCLADRRGDVRVTAARLLTALPGSALADRAAGRALAAVRVERGPLRRRLAVTLPAGHDAGMARDQVPAPPARTGAPGARDGPGGPAGGSGAWLVLHLVAAAPLTCWRPGLGGPPGELAALDVADGWRPVVWSGWARAAIRERDEEWAAALLDHPPARAGTLVGAPAGGGAPRGWPGAGPLPGAEPADPIGTVGALLSLLPDDARAARVAGWLRSRAGLPAPIALVLRAVPGPWPEPLAAAVLHWLSQRPRLDEADGRAVLDLAARRLPGDGVQALREVAGHWPAASPTRRLASAAAELMSVRRTVVEELQ